MIENYNFASAPAIAAFVYIVIYALKRAVNKESFDRFIPIIAMILGAAAGIAVYFTEPSLLVGEGVFSAIITGAVSGLSATGADQIFKQLDK